MQRFLIVLAASLVLASAASSAVRGPPVRPAKDADAADHKFPGSYLDWWRLHAVEPRTGRYLLIRIHTNGGPFLSAVVFDGHRWHGGAVQTDDPWEAAILQRVRRGWKLDLDGRYPSIKGSLRLTGRPGVTVGPWRLGLQVTHTNTPPWEHGSLVWSALVPTGRLDGWVDLESFRVDIRGWRGYLDHTWVECTCTPPRISTGTSRPRIRGRARAGFSRASS